MFCSYEDYEYYYENSFNHIDYWEFIGKVIEKDIFQLSTKFIKKTVLYIIFTVICVHPICLTTSHIFAKPSRIRVWIDHSFLFVNSGGIAKRDQLIFYIKILCSYSNKM
jgi:hypothetical protein